MLETSKGVHWTALSGQSFLRVAFGNGEVGPQVIQSQTCHPPSCSTMFSAESPLAALLPFCPLLLKVGHVFPMKAPRIAVTLASARKSITGIRPPDDEVACIFRCGEWMRMESAVAAVGFGPKTIESKLVNKNRHTFHALQGLTICPPCLSRRECRIGCSPRHGQSPCGSRPKRGRPSPQRVNSERSSANHPPLQTKTRRYIGVHFLLGRPTGVGLSPLGKKGTCSTKTHPFVAWGSLLRWDPRASKSHQKPTIKCDKQSPSISDPKSQATNAPAPPPSCPFLRLHRPTELPRCDATHRSVEHLGRTERREERRRATSPRTSRGD